MRGGPGNRSYEKAMASPCWNIFDHSGPESLTAATLLANAASFTGSCDVSADRLPLNSSLPRPVADVFGVPVEFVSLSFSQALSGNFRRKCRYYVTGHSLGGGLAGYGVDIGKSPNCTVRAVKLGYIRGGGVACRENAVSVVIWQSNGHEKPTWRKARLLV